MKIYDQFIDFLQLSLTTSQTNRLLQKMNWEQEMQFFVDEENFTLNFYNNQLSWKTGVNEAADFMLTTRVYSDKETFAKIVQGVLDSVDAQYKDEAIKFLPSGKYTQVAFFHQLIRWGQQEMWRRKKEEIASQISSKF